MGVLFVKRKRELILKHQTYTRLNKAQSEIVLLDSQPKLEHNHYAT